MVFDHFIKSLIQLLPDVLLDVGAVQFPHFEPRSLSTSFQVLYANSISDAGLFDSSIPKQPYDFRKGIPSWSLQVNDRFLSHLK
jgi:hypothetical protein